MSQVVSPVAAATPPDLIISQIKVNTTGQFITLYNNTDQPIDMSRVAVQYFNNSSLSAVTSTKSIQLSGMLMPRGYYLVNDGPVYLCYQMSINSISLGFNTKNGMVQVVRMQQLDDGTVEWRTQDSVSWASDQVPGTQLMPKEPVFLQRQTSANQPVVGGLWQQVQPADGDPCSLVSYVKTTPTNILPSGSKLLPGIPPPATIISVISTMVSSKRGLPATDIGLMAPNINEILPNPAKPQTDANDEFVEIYNPNDVPFDLSGFKLQVQSKASSTKHTYTFPNGTHIAAKSFAAYPSSNISISISNDGGYIWLLDPLGQTISATEKYDNAKEGQSWALANGQWYWTTTPTPGKANVVTGNDSSGTDNKRGDIGTVQSSNTAAKPLTGSAATNGTLMQNAAPLHPVVLVGVGVLALIYGLYEYRYDLANRIHVFRRYRANRRQHRRSS